MQEAGIQALVVKGIVCRNLYPKPDYRVSGDEDVLIPAEQFDVCHQALTRYGMKISDPSQDMLQIAIQNGHLCHVRRSVCDIIGGQPKTN